jgi:hypothetical protein
MCHSWVQKWNWHKGKQEIWHESRHQKFYVGKSLVHKTLKRNKQWVAWCEWLHKKKIRDENINEIVWG